MLASYLFRGKEDVSHRDPRDAHFCRGVSSQLLVL